jgi:hypothetical protein
MTTLLSEHFTLIEMTSTLQAFANKPDSAQTENLRRLCLVVLEPLRGLVGPLRVNSGFRSPAVNAAVGGAQQSAHLDGRAADVVPVRMTCRDAMLAMSRSEIPFDRAIYERRGGLPWIHVQVREQPRSPRREMLMSVVHGVFDVWNPADPRIT